MAIVANGIKIKVQQKSLQEDINVFGTGVSKTDYDAIKDTINASGEVTVVGYTERKMISPTPAIVEGTVGVKLEPSTLVLTRENAQPIFWKTVLPSDDIKAKAVANALINNTIGGAKVIKVARQSGTAQLA